MAQFKELGIQYLDWNNKINLISRKDIPFLYEHHILHSLGIARLIQFRPGAEVLDLGTGGRAPWHSPAILFPETRFTLIDGTGKKIAAVKEICQTLELNNVEAFHMRAEDLKKKFDFVVTRGVASMDKLILWTARKFKTQQQHAFPNGLFALKGGNLKAEIDPLRKGHFIQLFPLSDYFKDPYWSKNLWFTFRDIPDLEKVWNPKLLQHQDKFVLLARIEKSSLPAQNPKDHVI